MHALDVIQRDRVEREMDRLRDKAAVTGSIQALFTLLYTSTRKMAVRHV